VTRLIAIDPGLKSGVAVFSDGRLLTAMEVNASEAAQAMARMMNGEPTVCAIEDQYMGAGRAFKSIKTLIEIAGHWRLLAESYGMKTMKVNPKSWQASLKVKGQGNARRAQCKRLSQEYAVAIWGERAKAWTDNVSDAAHIGRWALAEIAMEEAKKKQRRRRWTRKNLTSSNDKTYQKGDDNER